MTWPKPATSNHAVFTCEMPALSRHFLCPAC
jgi:hypothetical protein